MAATFSAAEPPIALNEPSSPDLASVLQLRTTRDAEGVALAVAGELDVTTRDRLLAEAAVLRSAGHGHVVLDLRSMSFVDASGMAAIVELARILDLGGVQTSILAGPRAVMRTFALAGLTDRLPFRTAPEPAAGVDGARVAAEAGCLLMVLEPDGRIAYFNRRCEEATGHTAHEALGRRPWELFLPPEEVERYRDTYARLLSSTLLDGYETWWQHRDGSRRLIRWTNATLASEPDSPILITGIDASPPASVPGG